MMRYVDAHCHVDQYPDPRAEVGACESAQTYTIAVTNLPREFVRTERLCVGRSFVRAAAGLHPELVARFPGAVEELLPLLARTKYVGEIGLDYTQASPNDRESQRKVLARVVATCEQLGGRVLTVHTRRAAEDALELLCDATKSSIILHWFSGSMKVLARAVEAGCFFSVNPAMARSTSGRKILEAIPGDRILTESDGPFVKHGGRELHPFEVRDALGEIARIRGSTVEEFRSIVLQNFRRAVSLGGAEDR